jgi:indolepyruvate ferredoxin oxidoreductase
VVVQFPQSLDALVRKRVEFLTAYQNAGYAKRYEAFVDKVRQAEAALGKGDALARAVARYLFKLMAYKDEYEVARLYTDGEFERRLKGTFEGDFRVKFNLAPPLLAKRDAQGHPMKAQYGPWMWQAFRLLARLKFLRGTALDPFGRTDERRMERALIDEYRASIEAALSRLNADSLPLAIELASLPEHIRGFGHVKLRHLNAVRARWRALERKIVGGEPAAPSRQAA